MIGAMTSQDTQRSDAPVRHLRRHTSNRVIGGVAGGIGDYFNVDPLLIRIGFVGLILFGGAGVVLYLIAWLMVPAEGQNASIVESLLRRVGLTSGRIITLAVIAVAFVYLINSWNYPYDIVGDGSVLWAAVVIVLGFVLIRRRDAAPSGSAIAPAPAIAAPRAPVPPRLRSPLAWYACGALLLSSGLLALVSQVADIAVAPGQFFGAGLVVLGIGLVVGAWWGRARILILLALLLVPLALGASFMTAPLEGGIGGLRFTPANAAELRDEYRLMGGTLILDLTDLSIPAQPVRIAASVAAGQLVVIVPPDASVELRARMGAGQVTVFDYYHDGIILTNAGTSLDEQYVRRHRFGPTYVLDLQGGIGDVFVTNSRVNW
jgi:phage shock protein PspC (stress-responsive transcriptional regulator)